MRSSRLEPVREGDFFLFYGSEFGFALSIVTSDPFTDEEPVWDDDVYPHRIKISEPIARNQRLRIAEISECLRDKNGEPYKSVQATARSIGGPGGIMRRLTDEEKDALFRRLGWSQDLMTAKPDPVRTPLSLKWLEQQTLWKREDLEELLEALQSSSPQIVLAGPPGTGKTWVAKHVARFITDGHSGASRIVQFHPSYSYEDFVEGLRPISKDGAISFERVDGVVLQIAREMNDPKQTRVLVIDEMNRANLPKVFGELMYLFEYRGEDEAIRLQYTNTFSMPEGLKFIGTMNTADRSIRSIDIALRRRFDVFECKPDVDILKRFYEQNDVKNEVGDLFEGFEKLNARLEEDLDRHHTIGHTFFMQNQMTGKRLKQIWLRKIGPLIEEYFFDQPDLAASYTLDTLFVCLVTPRLFSLDALRSFKQSGLRGGC